jgi:hypothetical protein
MRRNSIFTAMGWLLLLGATFITGCGDDDYLPYDVVGAACRDDFDCAPGVACEHGKEFGDGTCALACRGHLDCPPGAACIEAKGGVCLPTCGDDSWCRPGFHCKAKHDHERPGDSYVCAK